MAHDIYDHDLWKKIKIIVKLLLLFPVIASNMMKLLVKVKAGKTMIKASYKVTIRLNCI